MHLALRVRQVALKAVAELVAPELQLPAFLNDLATIQEIALTEPIVFPMCQTHPRRLKQSLVHRKRQKFLERGN